MHEGARTDLGPLSRFLGTEARLGFGPCTAPPRELGRAWTIAPLGRYGAAYNLSDRAVEERELPLCRARGPAFLPSRPLGGGLLTGKSGEPPAFPGDAHRRKIY